MKYLWFVLVCVAMLPSASAALADCPRENSRLRLPQSLQGWWQTFRGDLDRQILQISDQAIEAVYEQSRQDAQFIDGEKQKKPQPEREFTQPAVIRTWLRQFVWYDLEPGLAAVLRKIPKNFAWKVRQRLVTTRPFKLTVESSFLMAGGWDPFASAMMLDPTNLQSYDEVRRVLMHECIHCLIEDQVILRIPNDGERIAQSYLIEGLTEYLTLQVADDLGWDPSDHIDRYENEVTIVALLLPIAAQDMWRFYLLGRSSANRSASIHDILEKRLKKLGLDPGAVAVFIGSCKLIKIAPLAGVWLGFGDDPEVAAVRESLRALEKEETGLLERQEGLKRAKENVVGWLQKYVSPETRAIPLPPKQKTTGDLRGLLRLWKILVPQDISNEVLPVLEARLFGDPDPVEPTTLQARLLSAAQGKPAREGLLAILGKANGYIENQQAVAAEELKKIEQPLASAKQVLKDEEEKQSRKVAEQRARLNEIAFRLHRQLLTLYQAAGVPILQQQERNRTPKVVKDSIRRILTEKQ